MTHQDFAIFKLFYHWHYGELWGNLLAKQVTTEQFEKDLLEAKKFAASLFGTEIPEGEAYLGKGYCLKSTPEVFEQILYYLTEKLGYSECTYEHKTSYEIRNDGNNIDIAKRTKTTTHKEL